MNNQDSSFRSITYESLHKAVVASAAKMKEEDVQCLWKVTPSAVDYARNASTPYPEKENNV